MKENKKMKTDKDEFWGGDHCDGCGSTKIYINDYGICMCRRCWDKDRRARESMERMARRDPVEWDRE